MSDKETQEKLREIVYRNWKNGDEVGLYEEVKKLFSPIEKPIEKWEEVFEEVFKKWHDVDGVVKPLVKDFIAQIEQQAYERGKNKSLDFISGLQTSIFGQQMQIDALLEELKGRNNHSLLSKLREKIAAHFSNQMHPDPEDSLSKDINSMLEGLKADVLSELEVKE